MLEAEESPLAPEYREKLLENLRAETRAHDAYMRARRQLWNLLGDKAKREASPLAIAA